MQNPEEKRRYVAETKAKMDSQYKHISLRACPFDDNIVKVIPSDNLHYTEDSWLDHLFFVTGDGYYFTNEDILDNYSVWDYCDDQAYAVFLKGVLLIAKIEKNNFDSREMPEFILNIIKRGRITGSTCLSGANKGKKQYRFSR